MSNNDDISSKTTNNEATDNLEDKEESTSYNGKMDSELIRQLTVLNLSINTIYIIVLAILMNINYLYEERDEKAISNANDRVLSSLLIFIATGISHNTLNF